MSAALDYPAGWPRCACGAPVLDGHLTCGQLACDEAGARTAMRAIWRDRSIGWLARRCARLQVGDVVVVVRASGVNPAHARGVVVEIYELAGRRGWTLLFSDGRFDGFSPDDIALFDVVPVGHMASVADYVFTSATRLYADWRAGSFAAVWR